MEDSSELSIPFPQLQQQQHQNQHPNDDQAKDDGNEEEEDDDDIMAAAASLDEQQQPVTETAAAANTTTTTTVAATTLLNDDDDPDPMDDDNNNIDNNNNNHSNRNTNSKKRRVSASYGSRTTIIGIGLKRRSCICLNSKECNEIMTKWAKCYPSMYHYVQLPKLAGMDIHGTHTIRNISDTELYKNQFRLATLRYLAVKNPIPKDERIALCHYRTLQINIIRFAKVDIQQQRNCNQKPDQRLGWFLILLLLFRSPMNLTFMTFYCFVFFYFFLYYYVDPQVRDYLYWPKNTPAHCKYAIPKTLAASLTNHSMDVNREQCQGLNQHDYCYAVPCYDFETAKKDILQYECHFYDQVKQVKMTPTKFVREHFAQQERIDELQQQLQAQQLQPPSHAAAIAAVAGMHAQQQQGIPTTATAATTTGLAQQQQLQQHLGPPPSLLVLPPQQQQQQQLNHRWQQQPNTNDPLPTFPQQEQQQQYSFGTTTTSTSTTTPNHNGYNTGTTMPQPQHHHHHHTLEHSHVGTIHQQQRQAHYVLPIQQQQHQPLGTTAVATTTPGTEMTNDLGNTNITTIITTNAAAANVNNNNNEDYDVDDDELHNAHPRRWPKKIFQTIDNSNNNNNNNT
jgi:hypothetical protein